MTTTWDTQPRPRAAERAEALAGRLFEAALGTMDLAALHIGTRLGLYAALADGGPATPAELAGRTGTDERYVREWLEQQAVTGVLTAGEAGADGARAFALPTGHDTVLLDADSPWYSAPMAGVTVGVLRPLERVVEAFRTGAGVPYADYGPDTHEGIAAVNRPLYRDVPMWMAAMPDLDRRLRERPHARIADVGCGHGWSTLALATHYPHATVDGLDIDGPSIERARAHARDAGLSERVRFAVHDAADASLTGTYALVTMFETLHDMPHPVAALRAARSLLEEGGAVLVADSRTDPELTAPGDALARFQYGCSVLHCLAVGRCAHASAATGTVMRPATLEAYARSAGLARIRELPIDNPFWRFHRLEPA